MDAPDTSRSLPARLGVCALLLAVAASWNAWALGVVFADDGVIEAGRTRTLVLGAQAACALLGLWALLPGSVWLRAAGLRRLLVGGGVLALAGGLALDAQAWRTDARRAAERADWERMAASEDVLGELSKELGGLKRSVRNLRVPDHAALRLFEEQVRLLPVTGEAPPSEPDALGVRTRRWTFADEPVTRSREELGLWSLLFDELDHVEHVSFTNVKGHFVDDSRREYESLLRVAGRARTKAGSTLALSGEQHVTWRRVEGEGASAPAWRVAGWHGDSLSAQERVRPMFEEVLARALPDAEALRVARHSLLSERWGVVAGLEGDPFDHPRELFELFGGTSPGVTTVDVDRDGLDDVFLVGDEPSLFLRGRPDGTFEDATEAFGLAFPEATSATFADLDNDGDAELFLGRNYEPSLVLEQVDGRFEERTARFVQGRAPSLVSAVSAADHDNDGLLDLYVSTYGFSPLGYERQFPELRTGEYLLQGYLPLEDAAALDGLIRDQATNWVIDAPGPPNVLLGNQGDGRLAPVDSPGARVFRNSFQATWSDYDGDGDQDLYVANDFSPNNLLRNDGGGAFRDVAEPSGTVDIGFGMGVTWGDYDQDGRHDLYVANMYSKAGKRVLTQFGQVDERLKLMYRGNSLFRNDGERFTKTSGTEAPALLVEAAGWSWGSQFVDVDNDGWLDLYALSGMITAPREYEIPVDI